MKVVSSDFCTQAGLPTYPASEKVLMLFAAHLHIQSLAHGTIKSYMTAICHGQIRRGLGDPRIHQMSQLEYMLKGIKKSTPQSTRARLPITPQVLMDLKRVWQKAEDKDEARLLWVASSLCFFGFLRSGEVTMPSEREYNHQSRLCYADVRVDCHTAPILYSSYIKGI